MTRMLNKRNLTVKSGWEVIRKTSAAFGAKSDPINAQSDPSNSVTLSNELQATVGGFAPRRNRIDNEMVGSFGSRGEPKWQTLNGSLPLTFTKLR